MRPYPLMYNVAIGIDAALTLGDTGGILLGFCRIPVAGFFRSAACSTRISRVAFLAVAATLLLTRAQDVPQDNAAPPAIAAGGITNAASRMPAGLPAGAVAPGSLFLINGWRMGSEHPDRIVIAVGAESVETSAVSSGAEEIEAVMPENVPLGNAELTVIRDGKASLPAPVRIAAASFGIYSRNKLGWGPGEILNADGVLNTARHAAAPGEQITIFGTGLGVRHAPRPSIFVGGKRVGKMVSVRKSAFQPGADEIRFVLPRDAAQGCYVPLRVGIDGTVSNTVTIVIGRRGDCGQAENWIAPEWSRPGATALFAFLSAKLRLSTRAPGPSDFPMDAASASFLTRQRDDGTSLLAMSPPAGTCTSFGGKLKLSSFLSAIQASDLDGARALDAGAAIIVQGSSGTRTLRPSDNQKGLYSAFLGGVLPVPVRRPGPLFLNPGNYQISVPGGADLAAFQFSAEVPHSIAWIAPSESSPVDRERGVTVEWKAVRPSDRVFIVAMNTDRRTGATDLCVCAQSAGAGSFLVPPDALANIPASSDIPLSKQPFSMILLAELSLQPIRSISPVHGLDAIWFMFGSVVGHSVLYR